MLSNKLTFILLALLIPCSVVLGQNDTESDDFSYPLKLFKEEFYDLAAQQFIKFYNNYPKSLRVDEAKYYAGMSYYNLSEFLLARVEFQSLALEFPGSSRAAESWLRIGECYSRLNTPKEASKAYETIRLLYPDDPLAPEGLYKAGILLVELNIPEKAQQNFNIIMEQYTASNFYYPAMVKAGLSLYNQNEIDRARNILLKALEGQAGPEHAAEATFLLAKIQAEQGSFEDAKNRFNIVIRDYPNSPYKLESSLELSSIYISENKLDLALSLLVRGSSEIEKQDRAKYQQFLLLLGDVHYLKAQFALAESEYSKVSTGKNDSLSLIIELKKALVQKKQNLISKATKTLQPVIKDYPDKKSMLFHNVDLIYMDWLESIGEHQLLISRLYEQIDGISNPYERIPGTLRLIKNLYRQKQWRDIIREIQPYLLLQEKYPEKDDFIYFLASSFEKINEYDQSVYFYEQLISEYSASEYYFNVKERLSYLYDFKVTDKDKAVSRLAKLIGKIASAKDNSRIAFELGKIYFSDLKDYYSAEEQFQQALTNNASQIGEIHLYLGKTYLKLSAMNPNSEAQTNDYLGMAWAHFKKAVENQTTCLTPDEAYWLMIESSVSIDTIPVVQEKKYMESLIQKYPESRFLEEWYENLAYNTAFDSDLTADSKKYFELLVSRFKTSEKYPSYLYRYARLLEESEPQRAQEFYRIIAADFPYVNEAAQAMNQLAISYETAGQFAEANQLFKRLISFYYYSNLADEARVRIGYIYYKSADYDNSIMENLKQIRSPFISDLVLSREFLRPDIAQNVLLLARSYMAKGLYRPALSYYKLFLNIAPNDPNRQQAILDCGEIYSRTNQKNLALDYFKAITNSNPELYLYARLYIANLQFEKGEYNQASQTYNELFRLSKGLPQEKDVYGKYIISMLRDGNINESKQHIEIYRKKYPDDETYPAQFILELGNLYRSQKQFDKALKFFEEVKKKYKTSEYHDDADYYSAITLITLNKNEEAFKILNNFSANYPKSDRLPEALNTFGSFYFRAEKYDAAISMFKNGMKLTANRELEASIMSNLIKTYTLTSFWDAAQSMSREYVDKFPDAEDKIDKKIIIAQAYINLNQFQNAIEYLRKIKLEADSEREPEIQYYIGESLLKAGHYEDAIAEFVKIPLMSKKTKLQWEASALYYSGQCYEKLGRSPDAIRMYEEIIKRPGIDAILKKEAQKRIEQIQ
jgi:TolA-binding protein